tara:strand:- start:645 stop:1175 length:531 start_codon:yes stop_codon:yes gene_type:complete
MKNSVPKSQSYPASIIRVGAILYEAVAYTKDDGSVVSGVDEWVVRSIRARRNSLSRDGVKFPSFAAPPKMVNLYQRNEFTWIKALGKSSSYDWAPSIWSGYKRQFAEGSNLPGGIYTTKRAALRYAIADTQDMLQFQEGQIKVETDQDVIEELQTDHANGTLQLRALQRRLKALAK